MIIDFHFIFPNSLKVSKSYFSCIFRHLLAGQWVQRLGRVVKLPIFTPYIVRYLWDQTTLNYYTV